MAGKARAFCWTDYVMDLEFWRGMAGVRYLVCGHETCPTTGRLHLQGYVYFHNPRSFLAFRALLGGRHVEVAGGSPQANRVYCVKENVILEIGEIPVNGQRNDINEVAKEITRNGMRVNDLMIEGQHHQVLARYTKYFDRLEDISAAPRSEKSEVIIVWGEGGLGKSHMAYAAGAVPVKYRNGFYMGYHSEPVVLFDEFDWTKMPREEWLQLTDKWPMRIEIKGGDKNWAPRQIWFTTNYNPVGNWYGWSPEVQRRVNRIIHVGEIEE